jgi:Fe-Mn family superoxide dismutase
MENNQLNSRRKFIKTAAAGTALMAIGSHVMANAVSSSKSPDINKAAGFSTPFEQQPLPYKYDALENVIDALTMEIHYSKHAAAYSKNLIDAARDEKLDAHMTLEELLFNISNYSAKLRNNGGGHYNHEMFWQCMRPKTNNNMPSGKLAEAIIKQFGDFAAFKTKFSDVSKNRFGSGWAWLYKDATGALNIGSTANQDNPLMNIPSVEHKGFPLLCLDVWEHAYYLKYQNKRADYIENWWNVVNWDYVQQRFDAGK